MIECNLRKQRTVLDVAISVNIDSRSVDELRSSVLVYFNDESNEIKDVYLDMTKVTNVDSVGLNFLVFIVNHMKKNDGAVHAVISSRNVMRTFEFTRMVDLIDVDDRCDDS